MYDPLFEAYPEPGQNYPDSYWAASASATEEPTLQHDIDVDIAVIGAGYTGLSAAYHLATKYKANVAILEANKAGWGCSGRNAGFVLAGSGRLSLQQMSSKWGEQKSKDIYREYTGAIETVNHLIEAGNIDCDKTVGGYLKLAHKKNLASGLKQQADILKNDYAENIEFISQQTAAEQYVKCQSYGGIYYPQCFAINPLKLAQGYHRLVQQSGVNLFANSPVIAWHQHDNKHKLLTPNGSVIARHVVVASNGYTSKSLHSELAKRHFPVLSSVMVTRPLSAEELDSIGIRPGLMVMDTRSLKYYYRILPDNRILFGGRGAIKGKDANNPVYCQRLLDGLISTFPSLRAVEPAYFWSGWISVAFDDYPRICTNEDKNISYAMGYCGSGVAFATQAGKRLAQAIGAPDTLPNLPFFHSQLPKFPFSAFKRLGLAGFYALAKLRD